MSSESNQIQKKLFGWDKFAEDIGGVYLIDERQVRFHYRGWECFLEWDHHGLGLFRRYKPEGFTRMYDFFAGDWAVGDSRP